MMPFAEIHRRAVRLAVDTAKAIDRHKWKALLLVGGLLAASQFVTVGINVSDSLPDAVFLVTKWDKTPKKDRLVAFKWHGGGPYAKGHIFVKMVKGVPGDTVEMRGREFLINGQSVGTAKEISRTGVPLAPGITGVIPQGQFYAYAPSPDSLDSRYAITGWIDNSAVVGNVIPVM